MLPPAPIATSRLRLRPLTAADAPFVVELLNEPGWLRFIGDRGVRTEDDARDYLEHGPITSYREHGFGLLAMELWGPAVPIGICGLLRRPTLADVDLGFALLARHEGRGLATEAAAAVLTDARDRLRLPRVVAITTPDNERSGRLLERIGMRFERIVRMPDGESLRLYAIDLDAARPGKRTDRPDGERLGDR